MLRWHRRRNAIHQLTLKVVLVGEEGQGKKSKGSKGMGQSGGGMKDRQTNRMVQVCRGPDQKEQEPGPRKPAW